MFGALLERLAREFDGRRMPYMVIGGQAVLVHGEPRLTRDIDITLRLTTDEFAAVLGAIDSAGLKVLVDSPEAFVRDTWVLPCEDVSSGIRVDLMFSFSAYEQQAIARSIAIPMGSTPERFAAVEDLVIHKLVAGRPRDIEDARIVLQKNTGLGRDYIRKWRVQRALRMSMHVIGAHPEFLTPAPLPGVPATISTHTQALSARASAYCASRRARDRCRALSGARSHGPWLRRRAAA